jgi:quercetin dioxygenase-like cupin family protein
MNSSRRKFLKVGLVASSAVLANSFNPLRVAGATSLSSEQWYWYPGHSLCIKAAGKDTGGSCMWMLVENAPREGVPFHKHLNEDESFYIISGDFEITVGDRTISGGPGTYVYGPRNVPHRWTNIGTSRAQLLNVFTPSGLESYFLEVAVPVPSSSVKPCVDMAGMARKMAAVRNKYGLVRTGERKYPATDESFGCSAT